MTQGFTGQEADGGTATLDYFNARHLSGVLGTFVQPDPANAGADITRPQSWNAYGYVLGNPLGAVDPDGTTDCDPWGGCQYYNNRDNGYGGYGGGDGYSGVTGGDCFSASRSEPCGGFPGGGVGIIGGIPVGGGSSSRGQAGTSVMPPTIPATGTSGQAGSFFEDEYSDVTAGPVDISAASTTIPIFFDEVSIWLAEIGGGVACVGSGVCEAIAIGAGVAVAGAGAYIIYKEHTKGSRGSTKDKHQAGKARQKNNRTDRKFPARKRPPNWRGPWPPAPGVPWQ